MSSGLSDDNLQIGLFDTVSAEQFGAAVLGFLTYRVPLFFGQIRDAFQQMAIEDAAANGGAGVASSTKSSSSSSSSSDNSGSEGFTLPGSAGVVAKLFSNQKKAENDATIASNNNANKLKIDNDVITILLVSGPQATGRSELVQQLLQDSNSSTSSSSSTMNMNLVEPNLILRRNDGATFERLERRDEFLYVDESQSSGFTIEGIMNAAKGDIDNTNDSTDNDNESATIEIPNKNVIVIDANVELAKRISQSVGSNVRIIGVWIGLNSVKDFEYNIQQQIDNGLLKVDESVGSESFMRGKIKDIITEIDFGLGSGIFEFTILNEIEQNTDGTNKSLMELKEAASYAFK